MFTRALWRSESVGPWPMNCTAQQPPTIAESEEKRGWTVRSARGFERFRLPAARGAHGPPRRLQGPGFVGVLLGVFLFALPYARAADATAEGESMAARSLRR